MLDKFNKIKRKVNSNIKNRVIKNKRTTKYNRYDYSKFLSKKVENNLLVKISMILFFFVFGLFFILTLFGACSTKIATLIWKNFVIPCRTLIFSISQHLTFKVGIFTISPLFIGFIVLCILLIINILLEFVIPMEYNKKYKKVNSNRFLLFVFCTYLVFVTGFGYLNQNNPKMDTLYLKKYENKKYKVEDIVKLDEYLKNEVINYSKNMSRDKDGNIIYNGNIINTAIDDLENASLNYDVLKGKYPKKIYSFNEYDLQKDPSTSGLTGVDTIGVNYNVSNASLLNTVTHELCHTKGIIRENEAVLCSVITGVESDNVLSNYSAYLEAFFRTNDALEYIDSEKALVYKNEVLDLCLNNNYKEICDIYRKDNEVYVNKSESILIGTYKLKSYEKEYIYELIDSLKAYKPKLYINSSKKIKKKELESYFDSENDYLVISINNSKDDFIKIKKILDKYSSRVRYIYQVYDGMYTGVDLNKKEAIKYYTSSIPRGTVFSMFKRDELYDYTRSVRLFLEYFDSKNV